MSEAPGLYLHVPFCERACPYCDFDFEAGRRRSGDPRVERFFEGLDRELEARAEELAGLRFDTLYLGGGTPSALGADALARLLGWIERHFEWAGPERRTESTVELNPEHVNAELLDVLLDGGVDRVSLGVQALAAAGLRQLGRAHDSGRARAAIQACQRRGLRCSVDLIVGWPGQRPDGLEGELDELLALGVEHLSIYALTIEEQTPWPKLVARGQRELPDQDLQGELLERVESQLLRRGLAHYEVASYGRRSEAVHNGKYWRAVDVVGLGPSAATTRHAPGGLTRQTNARGLDAWAAGAPSSRERLQGSRAAAESLWLGLRRLDRGVAVEDFLARFQVSREWLEARVLRQVEIGNLEWTRAGAGLRVSPGRWLWHDSIALDLIEDDAPAGDPA